MIAPDTTAASLEGLLGTMIGLITIAVVLRFVARRQQGARLRADDWLTVPVLVCRLVQCNPLNHRSVAYKYSTEWQCPA